ncbi:uncharacterized protein LOC123555193 [Mercenaria mercenaria]|uniref:uncharacterized protein LOC123555193 n=1 Tax=Mercenaria mercenaria TaxID=6596 RepID=UPI00234E96A1|nr:uncharacterized protein LOC123555193 [Mercenaria mercenaria]
MSRAVCVIWLAVTGVVLGDPCTTMEEINDLHRSVDYQVKDRQYDLLICDRRIKQTWYKFSQGRTMANHCVQTYHCGTHIPLWLKGTPPSQSDGIVTREVCGASADDSDCCQYKDTIRVKNCGSFFVYELKSTRGCSRAYCAGTGNTCPIGQWSPTGFQPGCRDMYPKMTQSPTLSNPIVKPDTFEFNCHINFDPSNSQVGFKVSWLFDNKTDPKVPVTEINGITRDVQLDQKYLHNNLGKTLSCIAEPFFLTTPLNKGPYLTSNGYWCGIKFSNTSLTVRENEQSKKVQVISTIPIVCSKKSQPSCKVEIYLKNNKGDAVFTECTQILRPSDWNNRTNLAVTEFEVLAERDSKNDGDKNLAVHFAMIDTGDGPETFNNYTLPNLLIHTIDKETAMCQCTNDPWCRTFDSQFQTLGLNGTLRDYFMLQQAGEFTMYKSNAPNRLFKTEIRTRTCGRNKSFGYGSCICAVAAQEGNDVIVIDMCHSHFGHSYPQVTIPNKNQGMVVNRNTAGTEYLVDFPSGAQVHAKVYHGTSLTVSVTAPEDDYAATAGLCGTFDKNFDNDFQHKNGQVDTFSYYPDNFIESWRIPIGSSIFDNKYNIHTDPRYDNSIYYCNCKNNKHQVDCRISKGSLPAVQARCPSCTVTTTQNHKQSGKKKRAAIQTDNAPVNYFFDYGLGRQVKRNYFPTSSGITRADAEKSCKMAFNQSSTINQCQAHGIASDPHIKMCIEDLKYSDDKSFIRMALDAAVTSCSSQILKNVTLYDSHGKPPAFITTELCPGDCSGHGTCKSGTCLCDFGYYGDSCEIDARDPSHLYYYASAVAEDSVLCDVTMRPCEVAYMAGDNFFNNSRLSCKVMELKFNGTAFVVTGNQYTTGVIYNNMYNIGCKLPLKSSVGGHTVIGYNVSISNDGRFYSNEVKVIKIDSSCMTCDDLGVSCKIMDHACMIDGNCRRAGEFKTGSMNQICVPSKNKESWTIATDTSPIVQKPDSLPTAPLGGIDLERFDIWTISKTGCKCGHDQTQSNCACCDEGGCPCPAPNQHQCAVCGNMTTCGTPQPSPEMGLDGYTLALADCTCMYDTTLYNCACCQNHESCQCGAEHKNQCVDCKHMDQCGKKPWLFGPPIPLQD